MLNKCVGGTIAMLEPVAIKGGQSFLELYNKTLYVLVLRTSKNAHSPAKKTRNKYII